MKITDYNLNKFSSEEKNFLYTYNIMFKINSYE